MTEPRLASFFAYWQGIRERLRANPNGPGLAGIRLLKLHRKAKGLCFLCGLPVPHPVEQLEQVTLRNTPTIEHVVPRSWGGKRGKKNLRIAHHYCNSRRGNARLTPQLLAGIRAEAAAIFGGE